MYVIVAACIVHDEYKAYKRGTALPIAALFALQNNSYELRDENIFIK